MKRFNLLCSVLLASLMLAGSANAQLISEFEPNPAGGDPADTTFELSGMPSSSFDLWLLSLENDGFGGTVDRAANVTGMFDSNGLAVVMVPDLENPSFTVVLTDSFTGMIGDDLDTAGDGTLDLTRWVPSLIQSEYRTTLQMTQFCTALYSVETAFFSTVSLSHYMFSVMQAQELSINQ